MAGVWVSGRSSSCIPGLMKPAEGTSRNVKRRPVRSLGRPRLRPRLGEVSKEGKNNRHQLEHPRLLARR
jgi:hypothetical protein